MSKPLKPCEGMLSEATKHLLRTSRDRPEWGVYSCEICGQAVGVVSAKGDWIPEKHWPSIAYSSRKAKAGQPSRADSKTVEMR